MSRHYVLGSWANADEFDYSGEQLMGNRHGKSVCMDHILPNGMANLKRYSDPVVVSTKVKPKLTAFEKICVADRSHERLCALSEGLDKQLEDGEIDILAWTYARQQIDKKMERSWSAICKLRGWEDPLDVITESFTTPLTEDLIESLTDTDKSPKVDTTKKHNPNSPTGIPQSTLEGALMALSDDNSFKRLYCSYKHLACVVGAFCEAWLNVSKIK